MKRNRPPPSLFSRLLLFLGLPLLLLWLFSAFTSYFSAMQAATQAYDRTLLTSARMVAERLVVRNQQILVEVPWVVLDSVELNMNDRLYYKVTDINGRVISGYDDLPALPSGTPRTALYPALAWFYHATYRGQAIRVARLLQPVNSGSVTGMVEITVAETLQSRHLLAQHLLFSSAVSQGGLVLVTLLLAGWLLRRVLKPMRQLSGIMVRRDPGVLTPLPDHLLPWSETRLLVVAFNRYIDRLRALIARQERFSADASHQLKTPLAVLRMQTAVALASPDPVQWRESLSAISRTLDHTVALTERLLLLAQLKGKEQGERQFVAVDIAALARECCFSRFAEARGKRIDAGYEGESGAVMVEGDPILLAELCANLLDNALKYTPAGGTITLRVTSDRTWVWLEIEDSGPGIDSALSQQALQPFQRLETGIEQPGAGLGLALVNDIARWHRTRPELLKSETLGGLRVRVALCPGG